MGGAMAELPFKSLLSKRLTIRGSVLRPLNANEKAEIVRRFCEDFYEDFCSGLLQPVIDRVLPASELSSALFAMENNQNTGKIVIRWN
jgi:NADPH:quinone reductase-like Zn-dependent oxidoreductase